MTKRNNFLMIVIAFLSTSHIDAMLCLFSPAQRLCRTNIRTLSTHTPSQRTIEHIYNDVSKLGDRECSDAYTTLDECKNKKCVRFAQTCAKSIQMQQKAQRKRDAYMLQLEIKLSHRHGIQENMAEHAQKLRLQFLTVCALEKEAILLMQQAQRPDDLEVYTKTFTLTAHKMRCISRQVQIMHDGSVFAKASQDVQEKQNKAILFARTEMPARWKMLCYNASRLDHPDEIITHDDSAGKE